MSFVEFTQNYNTEQKCIGLFKELRDKSGVYCNRCGHEQHFWLPSRLRYRCKNCNWETTLRSGTALEYSKLPVRYWVYAIAMLADNMKSVSAIQVQRYLGHPYYRPIWLMMQKLRVMMADLVDWYAMLDHLAAGSSEFKVLEAGKSGKSDSIGSKSHWMPQLQSRGVSPEQIEKGSCLVSAAVDLGGLNLKMPDTHKWSNRAPGARLRLISMKPAWTDGQGHCHPVRRLTTPLNSATLPAGMNIRIRSVDRRPRPWFPVDNEKSKLRFTKIMVVNAKRNLVGIHHYVSQRYLRNYLGEFCYLTNRRYSREEKIEHLFRLFVSKPWNLPYIVQASD
jgi:hypothetical protein